MRADNTARALPSALGDVDGMTRRFEQPRGCDKREGLTHAMLAVTLETSDVSPESADVCGIVGSELGLREIEVGGLGDGGGG